ncbi:MAG: PepSY domain-containing protein [Methylococcales bacterium]|nr:PepSY domain-containing protein [Methylococcales bacterium]
MNRPYSHILLAGLISATAVSAQAAPANNALDTCVKSALEQHPGQIVSLRSEIEDNKPQFELDIQGHDGVSWEVECQTTNGAITETEREIAADASAFSSKGKVRLDAALKTALDKYPGTVVRTEYELEANGGVAYEFDIKATDGQILEVEVDAITGKLGNPERIIYQIGAQ